MKHQQQSPGAAARLPVWESEVAAAHRESDPEKVLQHVHAAEAAIATRLRELAQTKGKRETHQAERQAIAEALHKLRVAKRDKLGFPDWNGKG